MRWISELLVLVATSALGITAFETSIFTFPSGAQDLQDAVSDRGTVSEDVARLILELRMQSPLASVLGEMETDTVDILNHFADNERRLFGDSGGYETMRENIIVIQGVGQEIGTSMRTQESRSISVPHSSPGLVYDFLDSLMAGEKGKPCIYHRSARGTELESTQVILSLLLILDSVLAHERGMFSHDILGLVDSIETWGGKDNTKTVSRISFKVLTAYSHPKHQLTFVKMQADDAAIRVTDFVHSVFQSLSTLSSTSNRKITAILLPDAEDNSQVVTSLFRRNTKSWTRPSTYTSRKAEGDLQMSPRDLKLHSNLAPVCHSSNSSCAEATNNCSGHGSCYLRYGSGDEQATSDCYACRCGQTMVRKSDGTTQKVQWGGPACQKKDISSPFFLIAGVSVLVVIMVSSAVGMLFSMGQLELPSVIGAGVGGSKTQS
ncbi:uncharacterized protein N7459_006747 [Penicillium hispanicum]|uniref:uncharacterized protein n=1 Tax=Penicillium hispanicum TaxID=1080232 RepID=UPI0025404877|nr:uncharacterized protein N7459_006747 [Penicillium hispanicum]KAJ5577783.1 hypothetical protein N7459_006747 [Penicillium hispanicum]